MKRRRLLQSGGLLLSLAASPWARSAAILAVRVWPAKDYTRVAIESDMALSMQTQFVANPPRLALDIEGIELNTALRELLGKVTSDDPYIIGVRVGQFNASTVRLVLDLRVPVAPQVFQLSPIQVGNAKYQHRLLLDLYPSLQADPLEALIAQRLPLAPNALPPKTAAPLPSTLPNPQPSALPSDPLGDWMAQQNTAPAGKAPAAPTPGKSAGAFKPVNPQDLAVPTPSVAVASPSSNPASSAAASTASPAASSAAIASASSSSLPSSAASHTGATVPSGTPATAAPHVATTSKTAQGYFVVVALDPGHGGEDPGAVGQRGTREKDVVLQIALKLSEKMRQSVVATRQGPLPMRVMLTRDADFFVPLNTRVQKARRVQADLMLSIHADAFFTPQARGASVFALSQGAASSAAARWMAKQENKSDLVGGLNLGVQDTHVQAALFDMSTTAQINDSLLLGNEMLGQMRRLGKLHKPQVEQAGFAVLKAPDIPSVLIETGFISNPDEEQLLASADHQDRLAEALLRSVTRYFQRHPPMGRLRNT